MKRFAAFCAAVASIALSSPASATQIFSLNGVTLQGGGTLTGTFSTNDALTSLLAIDITASAGSYGGYSFSQFTYDKVSQADWVSLPTQGFRITTAGGAQQLRLDLLPLTATGATVSTASYEYQSIAGPRTVTGGRAALTAPGAVPEPATWAMMVGGLGMIGAAMRFRSRKVSFANA